MKVTEDLEEYKFAERYEYLLGSGFSRIEKLDIMREIFYALDEIYPDGIDDMLIRDIIRFDLNINTEADIRNDYSDAEDYEDILEFLGANTYVFGHITGDDGEELYIYTPF